MSRLFVGNSNTDIINTGQDALFDGLAALTLSIWCYRTADNTAYNRTFSKGVSLVKTYGLFVGAGGDLNKPFVLLNDGADRYAGPPATAPAANTWYHHGATWDGANLRNYVDGVETASSPSAATGTMGTNALNLAIGADPEEFAALQASSFPGRLAEPAIWNVAASAGEMAALARGVSPLRIRPTALLGYWPLFGVGSPEPDYSGNGNNGTITGSVTQADHAPVQAPFGGDTWRVWVPSAVTGRLIYPNALDGIGSRLRGL